MSEFKKNESSFVVQQIQKQIESSETLSDLMVTIELIEELRTKQDPIPFWEWSNYVFNRIFDYLDSSEVSLADHRRLVYCLFSLSLEDVNNKYPETMKGLQDIKFIQFELRRRLSTIVRQIDITNRWMIFSDLEPKITDRLTKFPDEALFTTISTIGMKSDEITNRLWDIAFSDSKFSESAVCTLIGLGIPKNGDGIGKDRRSKVIELGRFNLLKGKLEAVTHIIWYLCGPEGMDLVLDALVNFADLKGQDYNLTMLFSGAARAIDRCDVSSSFHEKIWDVFRINRRIINMNASFAFGCQSPRPIRDYLDWLVENSTEENLHIQFSITRARIGELYKPQHLDGFDMVDKERTSPFLEDIAAKDSGIKGLFATPILDAKQSSIQWLQCLGTGDFIRLSTSIILRETSPYVVHRLADLLSASQQDHLPSDLCMQIESPSLLDSDESENYLRQSATIQLAHASESREAFLAMTRFGYLHRGNIPLSVIDALTDLAKARVSQGDSDVCELIMGMISRDAAKHHREAGVAVFCRLIGSGYLFPNAADRLQDIANDHSLEVLSQRRAFIALGSANVKVNDSQLEWLRAVAFSSDLDLQPDAFEGFLLRDGIQVCDYPDVAEFLGCEYENDQFRLKDPRNVTAWQAHMLAHLYLKNQSHVNSAIETILKLASGTAIHQVTWAIEKLGVAQPRTVVENLRDCVLASNNGGRADTDLIRTLGFVSPELLSYLVESGVWTDWLEPGRIALAENLRICSNVGIVNSKILVTTCAAFINDPSFQVRRMAYRLFARIKPDEFVVFLRVLASNEDPELISRAAEGIRWLPSSQFDDEFIHSFALATHRLPEIREIAKDATRERRDREWGDFYTNAIESAVLENRLAASEFRQGTALEMIGDDETIERLRALSNNPCVKPRIRFWLTATRKAVEKQWKKTLGQSAQPWSLIHGTVQKVEGSLYVSCNDMELKVNAHLWKHERKNTLDRYSWGGVLELLTHQPIDLITLKEAELRIPGREACRIQVFESSWRSNGYPWLSFLSKSPWPEET